MFNLNKNFIISLIVLTIRLDIILSSKILTILSVPYRDNQLTFLPLIENLIEKGHFLTIATTNPEIFLNNINYENSMELIDLSFTHNLNILNELKNDNNLLSGTDMLRQVFRVMTTVAEIQLNSIEIQQILRNNSNSDYNNIDIDNNNNNNEINKKFDAVIVDWSGPCLMNAFAYKYQIPLIGITPGGAYMTSHEAIGNPNHPVLYPSILMPFSENLSLLQKIFSVYFSYKYRNIYFNEELPVRDEIAQKIFGSDTPSLWDIQSNADLLLINSFQVLGNTRPVGPTTIHLGGIHAKRQISKLPKNLELFLNNADNDVVYVNFGNSVTKAFIQSEYRLEKLLKIFEMSRFDVVWNMNGIIHNDFNASVNIYQNDIIDQEDVLAHQNVKLFITIGQQHDIEDAIQHKVPCLGFTFSSNVEHYLLQVVKNKAGLVVNFDEESTSDIWEKIEEFGITDKFERNMIKLHDLVHDQPMSSIDRAVWWIEYVIRNGGTKTLKNSYNQTTWFNYLLMDVIFTILIVIIISVCVLAKIIYELRKYSKSLPVIKITRRSLLTKEKLF